MRKMQRCTKEVAAAYVRKEGAPKPLAATLSAARPGDRRVAIWATVHDLFGDGSAAGLRCERFLCDALYRWMLACCRSPDSWSTYAKIWWAWADRSDKRSLSAQVATVPRQVSDYLHAREAEGLAPRSLVLARNVLRSWFAWLFDRELIYRTPISRDLVRSFRVDHATVRKADGTRQALSLDEAKRVARWCLTAAAPEAGVSVLLQLVAGLRAIEVTRLERRHLVDRDGVATLTVPGKGGKGRQIVLEGVVLAAWRRYVDARRRQGTRGALLTMPGGGPPDRRTVRRWAKAAAAVVGRTAEIASHDLRKSAITLLMEGGATLDQAQAVAGHSSMELTQRCYVTRRKPMTATTGIAVETTP